MEFIDLTEREKEHFEAMWTVDKSKWALLRCGDRLIAVNTAENTVYLIEDENITTYVKRKLVEAGAPILDTMPAGD